VNNIKDITIALCEGPHDTAFLYRILKTRCFVGFKETLDKLPSVVGNFIISKNKLAEYNQLKIDSLKNEFVPYRIMYKNEKLILLYSLGGDKDNSNDEQNKRLIILKHFLNNISSNVKDNDNYGNPFIAETEMKEEFFYKFLFFYDADEDKEKKLNVINRYLEKMSIDGKLNHNQIIKEDKYSVGAYIFSNQEDTGTLEDVLFGLMRTDNETIFDEAERYYKTYLNKDNNMNNKIRTKRLSTECTNGKAQDKRKDRKQEDEKKSIICIAGQLQKKGKANTVIIEDSDYLNLEKIQNSKQLQEIANFIIDK